MRACLVLLAATVALGETSSTTPRSTAARIESTASAATCPSIESRVDCGFVGISSTECEARGCCYAKQTGSPSCYYPAEGVPTKKAIIVVSNHFDGGYTLPVNEVVQLYWDVYFPLAAVVGAALEKNTSSKANLQWMTQSWLVDMFFNCPSGPGTAAEIYNLTCPTQAEMDLVEAAIKAGYITYHAFPHNGDLELATPSLLEFGVNLTHALDDRFGLPHKTVLSQRDVPGFPRAGLASLNKVGVDVLSEGSNSAMNPPNVPPVFLWKDELSGAETIVEWHALGYGQLPSQRAEAPGSHSHVHAGRSLHAHDGEAHGEGADYPVRDYLRIPGCDTVLVYAWRSDNRGPPLTTDEVEGYFSEVQDMFPGAEVVSGTLEDFAAVARQYKDTLITVTGEIGDTWLMSAASDAKKLAQIRALQRAADDCVSSGACDPTDGAFVNFRKRQLKGFEHTLGLNVGKTGKLRTAFWSNEEFYALVRADDPDTKPNPESWARQYAWCIKAPLAELPSNHPLLGYCNAELKALEVSLPSPSSHGYTQVTPLDQRLESLGPAGRVTMRFEPSTGAIAELADTATGIVWANKTADGNSSIGLPRYQTLTQQDWAQFREAYIFATTSQSWANETYGKPNMSSADPVHQVVAPTMTELWMRKGDTNTSVLMRAAFDRLLHTKYGCPTELWVRYDITSGVDAEAVINITITAVNKSTTRLSEAAWFTFNPAPGASHPVLRRQVPDEGSWADAEHTHGHMAHSHGDHVHSHGDHVHSHGDHVHSHADHVHSHGDHVHSHGDHVHSHADGHLVHSHAVGGRELHAGPQSAGDWEVFGAEAAREAIHMARHRAVDATPEHLRDFYKPYHADAHYEWSDAPEVRALANSCDSCRLGRKRVAVHETDRSAYQAWAVHKFGEWQDPTNGVQYGGESVQAVSDSVRYSPAAVNGTIRFDSPDAGIVRWGPVSPFPLPMPDSPTTNGGTSFTLWSNSLINTNVPFWQPWDAASFQDDYAWRFAIVME